MTYECYNNEEINKKSPIMQYSKTESVSYTAHAYNALTAATCSFSCSFFRF